MAGRSADEYVAFARTAITELLDQEHAAGWLEVEAKIADAAWPGVPTRVDPHHLGTARRQLLRGGRNRVSHSGTRGGREVVIVQPADTSGRSTAIAKAAQRKRLLLARYLGWAQGTPSRPGVIGPAAERVAHESLKDAACFQLVRPDGHPVSLLLGREISGPLDHAVIYTPSGPDGLLLQPIAVPIEVKNLRDWIYPSSQELYQLLWKSAKLQQERPEARIAPVLVCRRAHYTTFRMAKALGFFIVQARRQYIDRVDEDRLVEVRAELGFTDLVAQEGADPQVRHLFRDVFTNHAEETADRWSITASVPELCAAFDGMRADTHAASRTRTVEVLRSLAEDACLGNGW